MSTGGPAQVVRREFEEIFPGQVADVHVAHDTAQLDVLLGMLQDACRRLQDLCDEYLRLHRLRRPITRQKVRCAGAAQSSS